MYVYLTIGIVFAAVGLLAYAGMSAIFSDERVVGRRLRDLTNYEAQQASAANPTLTPFRTRVVTPAAQSLTNAAVSFTPSDYNARLKHRLVLAGSIRGLDTGRFVLIKMLMAIGVGLFVVGMAVIGDASALIWLAAIALTILSYWVPDLWLSNRIEERQKKIRKALPDMLDMLTISVEAGLGFDQAVSKLVRSTSGPLAEEFGRMLQETQAGADRSEALKHLGTRTEVAELNSFITAIVQADIFGISVANVLRTQAKEMRLMRRQRAEEQAQKTPVLIVFPLVLCILPATMIVILGPAALSIGRAFGIIN